MNAASAIITGSGFPPSMSWRQAAVPVDTETTSLASPPETQAAIVPAAGAARPANEVAPARTETASNSSDSPMGRYPSLAFVYNQSASRLVMLYRSPTTGETESQIPSEVALRMYETVSRPPRRVATAEAEQTVDDGLPRPAEAAPTVDIVVSGSSPGSHFDSFSGGGRGPGFGPPPQTSLPGGDTAALANPVTPGTGSSASSSTPPTPGSAPASNSRVNVMV